MTARAIDQEAARRAYRAGLGASEWEACLTTEETIALMRVYRAGNEVLVAALEQARMDMEPCRMTTMDGAKLAPCLERIDVALATARGE